MLVLMSRETIWDPTQYGRFGDERSRPFHELISRIPLADAARVADLGCGSGELTATLARRWPGARIEGVDRSPDMIAAARAHETPRLIFRTGDVTAWRPADPVDVIVSNAVLHWVPGHEELLARWVRALTPAGYLAFQVPASYDQPSHTLLRELCEEPEWQARVGDALWGRPVLGAAGYLDLLASLGCRVDAWETTYAMVLQGPNAVLEWVKGTTLRPILTALGDDSSSFLAEYGARLRAAYPARPYGTVFPFRRVFVVAGAPA
jgi:trans-aconitate 2-methyltransferase